MKYQLKPTFLSVSLLLAVAPTLATANSAESIKTLESRIKYLEQRVQDQNVAINQPSEESSSSVEVSGLIEVETSYASPESGDSETDIAVATVELGIAAEITENLSTEVGLLYEEDDTDLEVDVAQISYAFSNSPISLTAGQLYVPFGSFETGLVSDPLTLELGETRESTLMLSYEADALSGAFYIFNGDNEKSSGNDIDNWGINIGYSANGLNLGLGYINNIGDSDTIQESLDGVTVADYTGGVSANLSYEFGSAVVIAEYTSATDNFASTELGGAKPSATNLEINFGASAFGLPATYAAAYQTTDEALALELPESKFLLGVALEVNDNFGIGIEYAREEDYGIADGGTDEKNDSVVVQLAASF